MIFENVTYAQIVDALVRASEGFAALMQATESSDEMRAWARNKMRSADTAVAETIRMQAENAPLARAGQYVMVRSAKGTGTYRVSSSACNCEAGLHGRACWHLAFAEAIEDVESANSVLITTEYEAENG